VLLARHGGLDWAALEDVVLGCATQAGDDSRQSRSRLFPDG
jgi:acetyl-CoA acyltransferase